MPEGYQEHLNEQIKSQPVFELALQVLDEDHGAPVHCSAVRQVASGGSSSSHGAAGGSRAQGAAAGGGGEQQQQQQEHEEELLVAGDEAVYCYTVEAGRKAAYALKGAWLIGGRGGSGVLVW